MGIFSNSEDLFQVVGASFCVYVAFKIAHIVVRLITKHFLCEAFGLTVNLKNAGEWAVITGATDGIGKAYAEQLAKRGLNVVLISRSLAKLEATAREVEATFKVKTKVIAADMSKEDIYENIRAELTGLDIGVLVNNVGCSHDHPEYFTEVDQPGFIAKVIHMNCVAVAMMTKIVVPGMVERRRGYVINIGSMAGSQPVPLLALYSGTKAYVELLTKSLSYEYSSKGVTFQYVRPWYVATKMITFNKPNVFTPTPTNFVKNALNLVRVERDTAGYWAHELQNMLFYFLPLSRMAMHTLKRARDLALEKKAAIKSD